MRTYFDTSFLFSFYIEDSHSLQAADHFARLEKPLKIGSLLYFEFCQSVRLAMIRKGLSQQVGLGAISDFEQNIIDGKITVIPCNWEEVHQTANDLSSHYTLQKAHQALDILHVATALTLGVEEFLTFDQVQSQLAQAEGLKTL